MRTELGKERNKVHVAHLRAQHLLRARLGEADARFLLVGLVCWCKDG